MNLIWQEVFLRPIFNLLIFFYNIVPGQDLGIAIILLTVVIKLILLPSSIKVAKSQHALLALQKEVKEIKKKYKGDIQKQNEETMKLYRKRGINPFSSCLPLLFQLPFFIALFVVLKNYLGPNNLNLYYSFIIPPAEFKTTFLGLINLAQPDKYILPILTGLSQLLYSHILSTAQRSEEETKTFSISQQMTWFFAIFIIFIARSLPAGLPLFWTASSLLSVLSHLLIERKIIEKEALKEKK